MAAAAAAAANSVQSARNGNLTCESREALRLVSRSARLNLAAQRALIINAPRLKLEATRLHLAEGIEYLASNDKQRRRRGREQQDDAFAASVTMAPAPGTKRAVREQVQSASASASSLRAYSLVLVAGQLMASDASGVS